MSRKNSKRNFGGYDLSWAHVSPSRIKYSTKPYTSLTKQATGYSLWSELEYNTGTEQQEATIDLGDGYTVEIHIMQDYDQSIEDDFGQRVYSPDEHCYSIHGGYVYVGYYERSHMWIDPEYSIPERYETIRSCGVNKHDALLIARNWAQEQAQLLRRLYDDSAWYYGYNVTVYHDGVELDSDSCWGFIYEGDRELHAEQDYIDPFIRYTIKQHRESLAATLPTSQYTYA